MFEFCRLFHICFLKYPCSNFSRLIQSLFTFQVLLIVLAEADRSARRYRPGQHKKRIQNRQKSRTILEATLDRLQTFRYDPPNKLNIKLPKLTLKKIQSKTKKRRRRQRRPRPSKTRLNREILNGKHKMSLASNFFNLDRILFI